MTTLLGLLACDTNQLWRSRQALAIDKWGLVLGGSWGSTLALAYAQVHLQDTAAVGCWLRAVVPEGRFDLQPTSTSLTWLARADRSEQRDEHPAAWGLPLRAGRG